jgi:hypothetical protein
VRRSRKRSKLDKRGEVRKGYKLQREALYSAQEGRCADGWGCGRGISLPNLDLAHLRNLGMGSSRHNPNDPRNQDVVLLCRTCHQMQEATVREMHRLWKNGSGEWVDPKPDNAHIVNEAIENGRKVEVQAGV